MKPAGVVLVMCLLASALFGIHRAVCPQTPDTTTRCDVGFYVPIIILVAVACGLCGLAILALQDSG